jgi:hypothetical protein
MFDMLLDEGSQLEALSLSLQKDWGQLQIMRVTIVGQVVIGSVVVKVSTGPQQQTVSVHRFVESL